MAELIPHPFASLIKRMFVELETEQSIFDFPAKKFFCGLSGKDYSVNFHNKNSSSPLGPASGPQTQMAQNILLSWLGGCRIMELKTVQILDELEIPRPCIDMQTVGYNVEWSQELRIEQSLHEYVKGAMLIEILRASGKLDLTDNFGDVLYDMSVGYDLAGIQSEKVRRFIEGMLDASEIVEHYRKQIPEQYREFRKLDFQTKISDTLTLSTFHGCPPEEIEKIIDYLFREHGLNCIIKLNPTLLGKERVRLLLNEIMGYTDVHVPDEAFENDATWEQAQGFVERLGATAKTLGLGFGVKFNNTLIVENQRDFFPESEKVMYLSGTPLHVLGINLVQQFRGKFGDKFTISFSAGIDKTNFADAVALGLTPITVCSDLLKVGGYSRSSAYYKVLNSRMDNFGVNDIESYLLKAYGNAEQALENIGFGAGKTSGTEATVADAFRKILVEGGDFRKFAGSEEAPLANEIFEKWLAETKLLNTKTYVDEVTANARYGIAQNSKLPPKVGTMLELFDCLTCDKCIPVCPNDANFALKIPPGETEILEFEQNSSGWAVHKRKTLKLEKKYQIANYADFCNECGNCDIFCPEDGGPFLLKPRFFGTMESFQTFTDRDGFFLENNSDTVFARFDGKEFRYVITGNSVHYSGPDFEVQFSKDDPENTISGEAKSRVSFRNYEIMLMMRSAILDSGSPSYLSHT
ncbi:MAG: glutamate synthase [SAR324 cluster bacterium]|jgi:putative selenate reductase|nr:glutamate synthase [SAR324 cluster bacterium]MCH2265308.1 glutamate synthase [SAR324 cluster bacterium]